MGKLWVVVVVLLGCGAGSAMAQWTAPPGRPLALKDTSPLQLRPGVKVEIYEFDDLECPPCSHAVPVIGEGAKKYNVPVVHHDLPLWEIHPWALQAAVTARYLKDAVSPRLAEDFRKDVFAHQPSISSQDDLAGFVKKWFTDHQLKQPFVLDSKGVYEREVKADRDLAQQIGLHSTPSIFVLTPKGWTQVMDFTYLDQTVAKAVAGGGKL